MVVAAILGSGGLVLPSEQPGPTAGILARSYAFVVVSLRYLIVGAWAAAVVLAILFLPPLSATSSGGLSDLIPPGSAAAHAESDAARLFGFPIDAAVAIVQRDPHGMPTATRDRAIRQAIAVDRRLSGQPGQLAQLATAAAALAKAGQPEAARALSGPVSPGPPGGIAGLAGAFPLPNSNGLLPGTKERSTTVITFLYFRPGTSFGAQTAGANAYVHWFLNHPADDVVGVTGPVPAEYDQSQIIGKDLEWVELLTVAAIALIVGLRFRSVGAPLATLTCAAAAYVIAVRVVAWLAHRMGVTLPPDLDPVLVVLLLGVTTDYTVFFLDGMRARLAGGEPRVRAARLATAEFAPIIVAAGVIVAAASASLVVARTQLLSAFGPGLALTVLTAMVTSMTLGPALMAIFGGLLFRPVPRWMRLQRELAGQPGVAEVAGPASLPSPSSLPGAAVPPPGILGFNPMLARSGGAARFVVVEKTDPLDATAISRVRQLQDDLPALGHSAGLAGVRFEVAGETALTGDSIGSVFADLGRIALAIMLVTLVLLALFLRSLLAPVYLLAASVLAVFATLGLTILIGQHILGYGSLVYFVPFAAGVLLVSLGSDYNVFVVGRIWEEARRRPVANAVAVAAPQASRAITTAGVALAASFAVLAVIPLEQFRQIAVAMALGVVIDAIAVRSLLVPALVALFGRLGMWPGNRRVPPVTTGETAGRQPAAAGDRPSAAG